MSTRTRLVSGLKRVGRFAADTAMKQPAIRERVEAVQARVAGVKAEIEGRINGIESDLWAWVKVVEEEVRKFERQQERARESDGWYDLLGLPHGAGLADVKRAYRRKMREHHPDRHAHDPSAEAAAHARALELNRAYAGLNALLTGKEHRRAAR